MAKISKTINPIEPKKMDGEINKEPKKRFYVVQFTGSFTYHSIRYEGFQRFPEGDDRLNAAKGLYKLVRIEE